MTEIPNKIEAILLFKNEPVSLAELSKVLGASKEDLRAAISNLQKEYENKGIVIIFDGEYASFGTHPSTSSLIEEMQKEELSRDLGRAGLETLAIILYRGPISRREVDYIRGVNSNYILRNLMIRGLIERIDSSAGERSFSYKPTLKLLEYLGVTRKEDLPDFERGFAKIEEFVGEESND
jgi:segregation and condensation protein B